MTLDLLRIKSGRKIDCGMGQKSQKKKKDFFSDQQKGYDARETRKTLKRFVFVGFLAKKPTNKNVYTHLYFFFHLLSDENYGEIYFFSFSSFPQRDGKKYTDECVTIRKKTRKNDGKMGYNNNPCDFFLPFYF